MAATWPWWGMFSFRQGYFILRFVFGLTDYQIGIYPMSDFMAEYSAEGRWVRQQRLHLSREEKLKVLHAIEENAQPENRTYRYNFFFDNCTTRAREMVITNIGYCNTNFKDTDAQSTYREEIHKLNGNHRWARFGNDLLLGYLSDRDLTQREWEFLPDNLSKDFATEGRKDFINDTAGNAEVNHLIRKDGYLMLVDSTCYLIPPTQKVTEAEAITPTLVFITLAVIIIALSVFEWKRRRTSGCWMPSCSFLPDCGTHPLCHAVLSAPYRAGELPDADIEPIQPHLRMEDHPEDAPGQALLVL